jgi:hypothetical protein
MWYKQPSGTLAISPSNLFNPAMFIAIFSQSDWSGGSSDGGIENWFKKPGNV